MSQLINLFVLFSTVFRVIAQEIIVDTTHGKLLGKEFKTLINEVNYVGFMGIPYAAPPLNDLRFLPPQDIERWDDVRPVTKETPACIQFNNNIKKGQRLGYYGVEDCLYLDIFTPALDANKRAVIVFLLNDRFVNSYNKTRDYAPDFLIEEDVILVTISHRLSIFGFLSLEDENLSGNSGMKDVVKGLEWVRDNLERFGGDPDRITLMGSQGGAAAVDLLIHSKPELFNSAIMQGDTSFSSVYLQEHTRERAFRLGELLDRQTSNPVWLLKELSDIPANDLLSKELSANPDDYFKENQRGVLTFAPIVEKTSGGLIKQYPESATVINKPIMIGFNSREGLEASLHYLLEPRFLGFLNKDFPFIMPIRVNFTMDPYQESFYDAVEDIKKFYFPRGKINLKSIPDYVTYKGDVLTAYPVDYTVRFYSQISSKPIYYYHFDYYSDLSENKDAIRKLSKVEDGTWGAATGDELCYLFKCPALKKNYLRHHKINDEENMMRNNMIKLWTNFAKYGNPTPEGSSLPHWPPYKFDTKEYLNINKQMEIKRDILKDRLNFWEKFIKKCEKHSSKGYRRDLGEL